MHKRLPWWISSALGLLRREMENILRDLERVGYIYDGDQGENDKEVIFDIDILLLID